MRLKQQRRVTRKRPRNVKLIMVGYLYVPQALEMEAVSVTPAYQLISGAVVVRDDFYFEAKNDSVMILSASPKSYSSISTANPIPQKISLSVGRTAPLGSSSGNDRGNDNGNNNDGAPCLFCGNGGAGDADDGVGGAIGSRPWQQIFP